MPAAETVTIPGTALLVQSPLLRRVPTGVSPLPARWAVRRDDDLQPSSGGFVRGATSLRWSDGSLEVSGVERQHVRTGVRVRITSHRRTSRKLPLIERGRPVSDISDVKVRASTAGDDTAEAEESGSLRWGD